LVFLLSLSSIVAQDTKLSLRPGWVATSSFKSEYATQAAAADERFVYAVSNTHVARYDRETKKLLGAGTMLDAKHLNSAFVWKGKVYLSQAPMTKRRSPPDRRSVSVCVSTRFICHTAQN
jgi:hypothetical protein